MTFFTKQDIGRVYVIKLTLPDGAIVYKIGMCHSDRSVDRMMEILRSWFMSYRFVPYAELKLDMVTQNPAGIEYHIHKILQHKQFIPNKKVNGGTEMFTDIDEHRVIQFIKHCKDTNMRKLRPVDYSNLGEALFQ